MEQCRGSSGTVQETVLEQFSDQTVFFEFQNLNLFSFADLKIQEGPLAQLVRASDS